jgi:hypothetical protein
LMQRQQHLKRLRRLFRSQGLCHSLRIRMTIRRRLRRLAPVCPQVREPLRGPPRAQVMRLR